MAARPGGLESTRRAAALPEISGSDTDWIRKALLIGPMLLQTTRVHNTH